MRKAHGKSGDHFDLLPFIAILMCTLGCLLFVTLSMAAIRLGSDKGEVWIPTADPKSTFKKTPLLVEWDGATVVVHQVDGTVVRAPYNAAKSTSDASDLSPDLRKALDWLVAHKDTHYVIVAVRQSAFGHFAPLHDEFEKRGITVGFDPIAGTRKVSLGKDEGP